MTDGAQRTLLAESNGSAPFGPANGAANVAAAPCPICKGRGWNYALLYMDDLEIDCGRCGGTGRVMIRQNEKLCEGSGK